MRAIPSIRRKCQILTSRPRSPRQPARTSRSRLRGLSNQCSRWRGGSRIRTPADLHPHSPARHSSPARDRQSVPRVLDAHDRGSFHVGGYLWLYGCGSSGRNRTMALIDLRCRRARIAGAFARFRVPASSRGEGDGGSSLKPPGVDCDARNQLCRREVAAEIPARMGCEL